MRIRSPFPECKTRTERRVTYGRLVVKRQIELGHPEKSGTFTAFPCLPDHYASLRECEARTVRRVTYGRLVTKAEPPGLPHNRWLAGGGRRSRACRTTTPFPGSVKRVRYGASLTGDRSSRRDRRAFRTTDGWPAEAGAPVPAGPTTPFPGSVKRVRYGMSLTGDRSPRPDRRACRHNRSDGGRRSRACRTTTRAPGNVKRGCNVASLASPRKCEGRTVRRVTYGRQVVKRQIRRGHPEGSGTFTAFPCVRAVRVSGDAVSLGFAQRCRPGGRRSLAGAP